MKTNYLNGHEPDLTKTVINNMIDNYIDINIPKVLQPKGLYMVRPSMQQYLSTRDELNEASKVMFEKIRSGQVKIKIFKKYKLDEVVQAHNDLEGRKILGPAIIIPN